jgi:membrane fusion protein, multidrug efflux system
MAEPTPPPAADARESRGNGRRRNNALWLFLGVLIVTVVAGFAYWEYRRTHVSTDDAYVDGPIHLVSPRIQGKVVTVRVKDNQRVSLGDPLLTIDPEPFAVREAGAASAVSGGTADLAAARADVIAAKADVAAARKELDGAKAQLAQLSAAIAAAQARGSLAAARLSQAVRDATRIRRLFERQVVSRESFEKSQTDEDVAKAQADLAREELRLAQAAIPVQEALVSRRQAVVSQRESIVAQRQARIGQQQASLRQREAALAEAKLYHGYTTVLSPAEGYVTRKNVEAGQVVAPGQSLLAIAALDNVWVVANYKETDIARIHPGQDVEIEVDTFKGKTFKGKVDSIMAGTGSAFALFPPENASGNYVKVVQRLPVKILLSRGEDPGHVLRIGMSVVPTVLVR